MKTIFALREKKEVDGFWRHKKRGHLHEILVWHTLNTLGMQTEGGGVWPHRKIFI